MNATARHLTAVPDPTPPDPVVDLIAAHVAAATAPHRITGRPDAAVLARVGKQARFDVAGLPLMLHRVEEV